MISSILSILILTFKAASSAVIPNFDLESTDQLLTSLAAHQQGLIPENAHVPHYFGVPSNAVITGSEHLNFQNLPQYIVCYIFEFLDYKSGKAFLETSKYFHDSGKMNILNRLIDFSPRFVFPSDWLNHAMACELSNLFKSPLKLTDPQILDEYELATIKSIRAGPSAHQLPPKIQSKLASYLFEMLYDAETEMRTTEEAHWKVSFIDKLFKNGKALYPKTLEYYKSFVRDECALVFSNEVDVEVKTDKVMEYVELNIDFFSRGVTNEAEFLRFFEKYVNISNENNNFVERIILAIEFELILLSHFHQFESNNSGSYNKYMNVIVHNQGFSQSLFEKVDINNSFSLVDDCSRRNRIFMRALYQKRGIACSEYIFNCNPRNRLDINQFLGIPADLETKLKAILSLTKIQNPTIALIDAIAKLTPYLNNIQQRSLSRY